MGYKHNLLLGTALSGLGIWAFPVLANNQPPLFTWTGAYFGGSAGYNWSKTAQSVTWTDPDLVLPAYLVGGTPGNTVDALFPKHLGGDQAGFAGGGQIGYNAQLNDFLFGLEGDMIALTGGKTEDYALTGTFTSTSYLYGTLYGTTTTTSYSTSYSTTLVDLTTTTTSAVTSSIGETSGTTTNITYDTTLTSTTGTSTQTITSSVTSSVSSSTYSTGTSATGSTTTSSPFGVIGTGRAKVDWVSTVRTRFGFVADKALIYATGGLAIGQISQTVSTSVYDGSNISTWSREKTSVRFGYAVGGGIEYAFDKNWSARGQYIYYDLGTSSYGTVAVPGNTVPAGITGTAKSHIHGNIVSFGVNYKFDAK
jgi:opacity protein-like surface antigen